MANSRLEHAKTRLEAYYNAEIAVLGGQEYTIGSRSMKRADLGIIQSEISKLENYIEELEAQESGKGRNRVLGAIPRDI